MGDVKGAIQRQFGGAAGNYATSSVFAGGVDLALIEREAAAARPAEALDLGTAAGHVAFALARHAERVVGLDLTHEMLVEAAKRSRAEVRFCQGDVEWLPFRSACFDLVTCRFSGHHFPNPDAFAGETARVLRPGGQLLLGDVVAPSDPALDRWINHLESLRDLSHVRDRTVAEWTGALQSAGLTCELLLDWRLELDFQAWVERIRTPPTAIAELRAILQAADAAPRAAFAIRTPPERPWSFQLHCAVVRARR